MKCAVLNVHATTGTITKKWKSVTQTLIGLPLVNTTSRKMSMSKLYKCPLWDYSCPYFCHNDEDNDFGLCLMQDMEGCSPVNECEAFDGVDEEDFEV